MAVIIRGLTWDHPRGHAPLLASAEAFRAVEPDVEIRWDRRSLQHFGDQPLEALAPDYDLIMIDHPFIGSAEASGCLRDLATLLGADAVDAISRAGVGPSGPSYRRNGRTFALPTDAACQVAAWRPDLLDRLGHAPPATFADVTSLGETARRHGQYLGQASGPTDAMCSFMTLMANLGAPVGEDTGFLSRPVGRESLVCLSRLAALSHPASLGWTPVATYEAMTTGDEIIYSPLAFGYVTYAPRGLLFGPVAGPGERPGFGGLLGGAGCAVTSQARNLPELGRYLTFLHSRVVQTGLYVEAGGQPGADAAWAEPDTSDAKGRFFAQTRDAIRHAHVRPRHAGFVRVFEQCGTIIHAMLRGDLGREAALETIAEAVDRGLDTGKQGRAA